MIPDSDRLSLADAVYPVKGWFRTFLDRPNGGAEVEFIYGSVELWFAICLTATADAMLQMTSLRDLYWLISHYWVAAAFWLCGLPTLAGLILYLFGNRWCTVFRSAGALVSVAVWALMFVRSLQETRVIDFPSIAFYFFGFVWQPRIMYAAWRRHIIAWPHG